MIRFGVLGFISGQFLILFAISMLLPIAVQGRLVGLAQHHDAALVVVTDKPATVPSLGSMVRKMAKISSVGITQPSVASRARAVATKSADELAKPLPSAS